MQNKSAGLANMHSKLTVLTHEKRLGDIEQVNTSSNVVEIKTTPRERQYSLILIIAMSKRRCIYITLDRY